MSGKMTVYEAVTRGERINEAKDEIVALLNSKNLNFSDMLEVLDGISFDIHVQQRRVK